MPEFIHKNKKRIRESAFFAGFLVLLMVLGYHCPIYGLVGIPCPGCGSTRAFLALLSLDWKASWNFSPLVLSSLVLFPILWLAARKNLEKTLWLWALLALGLWIGRMLLFFPQDPMAFNSQALLWQAVQWF